MFLAFCLAYLVSSCGLQRHAKRSTGGAEIQPLKAKTGNRGAFSSTR